ncbi:MAG: aspartate--tRNA ligase [Candidatus Shikimatogenerans bostrichidophilus]|nr:MAG: aspartate--tRNA ligase [Candidatus Shikimatogenerans bostrichidophilus]
MYIYRTHNCGELNKKDINKKVILSGWVHKIRKMKKIYFIDIRDFYGITQLFIKDKKIIKKISNEYLIRIKGKVIKRKKKNNFIKTGEIEINVKKIFILNKSNILPFNIEDNPKINKNIRFKYRYLDIRRNVIKNNLLNRFKIINKIRNYFIKKKFIELETPFLVKSTPEGARDFIIPSRKYKKLFYSLPQSPQIFKQLFMIGNIDKYFQIVKCFRDEDLRNDRQSEFTQLDIEMSLIKKKDILLLIEKFIKYIFKKFNNQKIINFKKIIYYKSIKKYKTDKPDLRNKIYNFKIKKYYINKKYLKFNIISFIIPNYLNILNNKKKKIKNLIFKKINKKNNKLFFYKYKNNLKYNIINKKKFYILKKKKFFSKYDLLILIINKKKENKIKKKINNIINNFLLYSKYRKNIFIPIWIINNPLFKYNKKKKKYESFHHPFTEPKLINNKLTYKSLSNSYDLIINGIEIGSGSIRINNSNLQKKIFLLLKMKKKSINNKFGFFLKALKYGTPPHGGIGIGIDRLILLILNKKDIKDIIPFPKNNYNKDIMLSSPSYIKKKRLFNLGLKFIKKKKNNEINKK